MWFQGIRKAACYSTLWKIRTGAISAPFRVFRRNIGQEEAFRRKPEVETEAVKIAAVIEDILAVTLPL